MKLAHVHALLHAVKSFQLTLHGGGSVTAADLC